MYKHLYKNQNKNTKYKQKNQGLDLYKCNLCKYPLNIYQMSEIIRQVIFNYDLCQFKLQYVFSKMNLKMEVIIKCSKRKTNLPYIANSFANGFNILNISIPVFDNLILDGH